MKKATAETSNIGYLRSTKKKEEAEVQNTLTLKSGGEKVSIPSFENMNNIANCKLISKIDKRGTIFIFTMHLS